MLVSCPSPFDKSLIVFLTDGGRNQMSLWSGGCHKHTAKLLMNSLCEKHNAFVQLVGCLVGWVGWWNVCRDMEDVRGFEVESFILGCQLPLPPLLSPYVPPSLFPSPLLSYRNWACFTAPQTLGQQHLFSCCLDAVLWQSALCVLLWQLLLCVCQCVCCSRMQTLLKAVCMWASVCVCMALHFNFKVWL